jgi:hypothetical protein
MMAVFSFKYGRIELLTALALQMWSVLDGECLLLCEDVPKARQGQHQAGVEKFGLDGCCFDSSGSTLFAFGGALERGILHACLRVHAMP